jgi:GNAT superfamily N-acetyltransferase
MSVGESGAAIGDVDVKEEWRLLRDETPVRIRGTRPSDRPAILAFVGCLSCESLQLRFFSAVRPEAAATELLGRGPTAHRLSVVLEAFDGTIPQIVGHAEYVRFPAKESRAEVAFLVADQYQGRGAGRLLLLHLARRARAAGIRTFTAVVLSENQAMRDVFTESGFPYGVVCDGTETLIELDIREEPHTSLAIFEAPSIGPTAPA